MLLANAEVQDIVIDGNATTIKWNHEYTLISVSDFHWLTFCCLQLLNKFHSELLFKYKNTDFMWGLTAAWKVLFLVFMNHLTSSTGHFPSEKKKRLGA